MRKTEKALIEKLLAAEHENEDGYPVLAAVQSSKPPREQWKVWCRHCLCWHFHGLGFGHRIAHCHKDGGPYEKKGYVLERYCERGA